MLIHYYRGLGAAVSHRAVEIERIDRMLAERAFECRATTQRFGCVISHFFSIVLRRVWTVGNRRATLEQEIVGADAQARIDAECPGVGSEFDAATPDVPPHPWRKGRFLLVGC
jgi:hypothetical protein